MEALKALAQTVLEDKQDRFTMLTVPFEASKFDEGAKSVRKKGSGRLDKHVGDIYLLAACPASAYAQYSKALEQGKMTGDYLWIAGALEGLCAVLCFRRRREGVGRFDAEILEKYSDAISNYLRVKDAEYLAIEAMFKLSRILIEMGLNSLAAYHLAGAITLDCSISDCELVSILCVFVHENCNTGV